MYKKLIRFLTKKKIRGGGEKKAKRRQEQLKNLESKKEKKTVKTKIYIYSQKAYLILFAIEFIHVSV